MEWSVDTEMTPRLAPIERPEGWMMKLVYWISKSQLGTVITPMKVIYARLRTGLGLARQMNKVEESLSLDAELKFLLKSYVATINGCAFCVDIAKAHALQREVPTDKYDALLRYETSDVFSERERAALAYVEEATREKAVGDATYERLATHFSEREITEITWLNALENYYNLLNRPLNIGSDELCALQ